MSCCCKEQNFIPFYGWVVFHHIHTFTHTHTTSSLAIYVLKDTGGFHNLATVNNATMNIGKNVFFQISAFVSFRYIPRSEAAGSYDIFSFLSHLYTVFYSSCNSLHSHQQCRRDLFPPHPCQHLLFVFFLMIAIPTSLGWYLTVGMWSFHYITEPTKNLVRAMWILPRREAHSDSIFPVSWGLTDSLEANSESPRTPV